VNAERAGAACDDKLYAAHEASRRAAAGTPFRDAYGEVAAELLSGRFTPDRKALGGRHTGSIARLGLTACEAELAARREWIGALAKRLADSEAAVFERDEA
jgi:argininosuccinate lyase